MYQNDSCNSNNGVFSESESCEETTLVYFISKIKEALGTASEVTAIIDAKLYGPKPAADSNDRQPISCIEDALKDITNSVISLGKRLNEIEKRL